MTAPPMPDEMRQAQEIVQQWNRTYWHTPFELSTPHLVAAIAAALSTTAAQAEAWVRQECAKLLIDMRAELLPARQHHYEQDDMERVDRLDAVMNALDRGAAAILAQTTPQETK